MLVTLNLGKKILNPALMITFIKKMFPCAYTSG